MIALRRPRMSRLAWHEARSGLLFLSPWIIGFLAFTLIPVIATLAFTFTNITLSQDVPLRFVGLDNYLALFIIGVWGIGGGIIVNQAGLKGIPTELYDAARIDGAGWWGQLRHVTLPMMSPVIFYTLVLGVVEVLQYFLVPLVLNQGTGEPGGATRFYNLYLYKTFFAFQEMSYGATLAWLLFLITLAITGVLFWSARYWVYYAGESSSS